MAVAVPRHKLKREGYYSDYIYGEALRWVRTHRDLSQTLFAQLIGVELRTYSGWERGEHPLNPESRRKLKAILSADEKAYIEKYVADHLG